MAVEDTVGIADRISKIRLRFPELKQVGGVFMRNYENANVELVNALRRVDGDFREEMTLTVYKEAQPYEELVQISYFNDQLTAYGEHIVEIRFCCGYIGNLVQGQRLTKEACLALVYAYECYWREGEAFLLGIVVENLLRRIDTPDKWGWPADAEFKRSEKNRQMHWLAYTVAKEMKELARFHRLSQPGMANIRTSDPVKPPLQNFRAVFNQIEEAAKAERGAVKPTKSDRGS